MIKEGHVQEARGAFRGRYRQTASNPLQNYAEAGQINEAQLEAGLWYQERWDVVHTSGRDSTDIDGAGGSGGARMPLSQAQATATRERLSVESRLSQENRSIIRAVVGERHLASHAVRNITGIEKAYYPIPRFQEALNQLSAAIIRSRANKWKFVLPVVK